MEKSHQYSISGCSQSTFQDYLAEIMWRNHISTQSVDAHSRPFKLTLQKSCGEITSVLNQWMLTVDLSSSPCRNHVEKSHQYSISGCSQSTFQAHLAEIMWRNHISTQSVDAHSRPFKLTLLKLIVVITWLRVQLIRNCTRMPCNYCLITCCNVQFLG